MQKLKLFDNKDTIYAFVGLGILGRRFHIANFVCFLPFRLLDGYRVRMLLVLFGKAIG